MEWAESAAGVPEAIVASTESGSECGRNLTCVDADTV